MSNLKFYLKGMFGLCLSCWQQILLKDEIKAYLEPKSMQMVSFYHIHDTSRLMVNQFQ